MANLMLSVMGAFAEFERSLIRERQREGITLAEQRGAYKGRKRPSPRTGPPNSSSVPAPVSQKSSLTATTESAGRPPTSTYARPSCNEPLPRPAVVMAGRADPGRRLMPFVADAGQVKNGLRHR